jgi:hypothetical protein
MATRLAATLRTARAQEIIDAAGTNPKYKFYNGTAPATGAAPAGTLLATLNVTGALGTASAGAIDINETVTQSNGSHVDGTPTFVRVTTSADAFVADMDIPSPFTFTGTIATGVDVTLDASTITEGNA